MDNKFSFDILIDVADEEHLIHGLVLPPIVKNKLPASTKSIVLSDYKDHKFVVKLQYLDNDFLKIYGSKWTKFVESFEYPFIRKLYFKLINNNCFEVSYFNKEGLEFREDRDENDYVHVFLMQATEQTCFKQDLPHAFLMDLNIRSYKLQNLTAKIFGSKQNATVSVSYVYPENHRLGHASGSYGSQWTNFCFQNEVFSGQQLLFINHRNHNFGLQVFNSNDIGLDITELSDEEETDDPANFGETFPLDDDNNVIRYNHRCNNFHHPHKTMFPHFFARVEDFNFQRNMLTLPKPFVNMYDLHTYKRAMLHFGHIQFVVELLKRPDCRNIEDQTHIVMQIDWHHISQKTGLVVGKILRFQLNLKGCLVGELADFDVSKQYLCHVNYL